MLRQPFVDEGIAPVDEVEDAPVLADHVLDEQLRLPAHREAEIVLEVGEARAIARDRFERAELQPLPAEVLGQRVRPGIPQHAAHLRRQHHGIAQRARIGGPAQARVRHARPDEVRQARRELVLGDPVRRGARPERLIPLDAEEEIRRHQQRRDADREPLVERLLLLLRFFRQADVLVDLAAPTPAAGTRAAPGW